MFLATINKPNQLLYMSYADRVAVEELEQARGNIAKLLEDLSAGFRLLADFSQLEAMDVQCARPLGALMELCDEKGVALVVRIIPDPAKDIGMNIISRFHYRKRPRIVTCASLAEAGEILGFKAKTTVIPGAKASAPTKRGKAAA